MSKIFVGLFIFYLTSGSIEYIGSNGQSSTDCYICDTYAFCGYNVSNLPACLNGSPCKQHQQQACEDIFSENLVKVCDRPGVFPDRESSENYYRCWLSSNSSKIIRQTLTCPEDTVFHPQAMLCLNGAERQMLKQIKGHLTDENDERPKILCKKSGFYAYPLDCKRYYYCNGEELPQIFECPFGTYYDNNNKNCTIKLTPLCKSQLNKIAKSQRLNAAQLLEKIKTMSKNLIPPGLCMRFCENNWPIIAENEPEVEYIEQECTPPKFTRKISLDALDKYEEAVLQLDNMFNKITRSNEEEYEEEEDDESSPQRRGFSIIKTPWHKLIIKQLLRIIKQSKSFLRKYIKENVCPYHAELNSNQKITKFTTQNCDYSKPQLPAETTKPLPAYPDQNNSTGTTTIADSTKKEENYTESIPSYDTNTSKPNSHYNESETFSNMTKTQLPSMKSTKQPAHFNSEEYHSNAETKSQSTTEITFNSTSSLQSTDSTTHSKGFDATTSSDRSDTSVQSESHSGITLEPISSTTASENHDSGNDTIRPDSSTAAHYSPSPTEANEIASSASQNITSDSANILVPSDFNTNTGKFESTSSSYPPTPTIDLNDTDSSVRDYTGFSAQTESHTSSASTVSLSETPQSDSTAAAEHSDFDTNTESFHSTTSERTFIPITDVNDMDSSVPDHFSSTQTGLPGSVDISSSASASEISHFDTSPSAQSTSWGQTGSSSSSGSFVSPSKTPQSDSTAAEEHSDSDLNTESFHSTSSEQPPTHVTDVIDIHSLVPYNSSSSTQIGSSGSVHTSSSASETAAFDFTTASEHLDSPKLPSAHSGVSTQAGSFSSYTSTASTSGSAKSDSTTTPEPFDFDTKTESFHSTTSERTAIPITGVNDNDSSVPDHSSSTQTKSSDSVDISTSALVSEYSDSSTTLSVHSSSSTQAGSSSSSGSFVSPSKTPQSDSTAAAEHSDFDTNTESFHSTTSERTFIPITDVNDIDSSVPDHSSSSTQTESPDSVDISSSASASEISHFDTSPSAQSTSWGQTGSSSSSGSFVSPSKTPQLDSTAAEEHSDFDTNTESFHSTSSEQPPTLTTNVNDIISSVTDHSSSTQTGSHGSVNISSAASASEYSDSSTTVLVHSSSSTQAGLSSSSDSSVSPSETPKSDSTAAAEQSEFDKHTETFHSTSSERTTIPITDVNDIDSSLHFSSTQTGSHGSVDISSAASASEHSDSATSPSAQSTFSVHAESSSSTETSASAPETAKSDSTAAAEHSDFDTESFHSTSSEQPLTLTTHVNDIDSSVPDHSSSSTQTGSPDSVHTSSSASETAAFDYATSSEHSDSATSPSAQSSSWGQTESSSSSLTTVSPPETPKPDWSTAAEHSDFDTNKETLHSTSSSHPPASATEIGHTDSSVPAKMTKSYSTISHQSTERDQAISNSDISNEINKSLSPFCAFIEAESENSNAELESRRSTKTNESQGSTLKPPILHTENETAFYPTDSAKIAENFHSDASTTSDQTSPSPQNKVVVSDSSADKIPSDSKSTNTSSESSGTFRVEDRNARTNSSEDHKNSKSGTTETLHNQKEPFKCPRAGVFRDPDDCHSYYRCTRKRTPKDSEKQMLLIPNHHTCKGGKYFSASFRKCVKTKPEICP